MIAEDFVAWRTRLGLSLSRTAEVLGLSRRTVAYYSNGEKTIPNIVNLACLAVEAGLGSCHASPRSSPERLHELADLLPGTGDGSHRSAS